MLAGPIRKKRSGRCGAASRGSCGRVVQMRDAQPRPGIRQSRWLRTLFTNKPCGKESGTGPGEANSRADWRGQPNPRRRIIKMQRERPREGRGQSQECHWVGRFLRSARLAALSLSRPLSRARPPNSVTSHGGTLAAAMGRNPRFIVCRRIPMRPTRTFVWISNRWSLFLLQFSNATANKRRIKDITVRQTFLSREIIFYAILTIQLNSNTIRTSLIYIVETIFVFLFSLRFSISMWVYICVCVCMTYISPRRS